MSSRLPLRARFALVTSALISGVGAALLTGVYLGMRFIPLQQGDFALDATAIPVDTSPADSEVAVLGETTTPPDVLSLLIAVSAAALLIAIVVGAVVSWFVAGRMLQPLRALADEASTVTESSIHRRLALDGPDDELTRLSHALEGMLERLERSFAAQRRFAANASHELRTPLATSKTLIELASDDPSSIDLPRLLDDLAAANARSITLVDALLDLSDAGQSAIPTTAVDLGAVVMGVVTECSSSAAGRLAAGDVEITNVTVTGHPEMLRITVLNLVSNAVTHGVGDIRVSLTVSGTDATLTVSNDGPVIDDHLLARLREPFYRVRERVSHESADSHGIGLALVAAIADAHGGSLDLASPTDGGLVATLTVPQFTGDAPTQVS